jgi:excinuclease ABC subunit C
MTEPDHITQHERYELDHSAEKRLDPEVFLREFDLGRVPTAPGCYLMKDTKGKIIYVGKAKNLRARVRTYINEQDSRYSVKFLMKHVASMDFLVTTNEKEALLLENSLIKKHAPRYNLRLKDDKTYVSVRLNVREDFPRLTVVRRHKKDGARYFGPYSSAQAVRQTLRQLQRVFPLRTCSDSVLRNRTRPCLYYQMKQCAAPCVKYVDREAYHEIVNQVIMVLEGRNDELEKHLMTQIQDAAKALNFEEAAVLRDRLVALRQTLERQRTVAVPGAEDRDVFGLYNHGRFTEIQVLFFRGGKMTGGRSYSFKEREMPLDELMSSFLVQYYAEAAFLPPEVLVPVTIEEGDALEEILSEQRGGKVRVLCPLRGEKKALVQMAERNARSSFEEKQLESQAQQDLLEQVQKHLRLPRPPHRIECFDISTTQGTKPVGSMVVFEGGDAAKNRYRHFAIREVEGQDDFAMMREVLMRRLTRAVAENDLPDLLLIDGGKGQLNVATAVLKDLGIEDLSAVGIAKSRYEDGDRSPERFFLPGRVNPVILRQDSPVVHFLARIRDEAHRFAITYHRKRRGKGTLQTRLTDIPGIGAHRARVLLRTLGSLKKIRDASIEEIVSVPGFSKGLAGIVKEHLAREQGDVREKSK